MLFRLLFLTKNIRLWRTPDVLGWRMKLLTIVVFAYHKDAKAFSGANIAIILEINNFFRSFFILFLSVQSAKS